MNDNVENSAFNLLYNFILGKNTWRTKFRYAPNYSPTPKAFTMTLEWKVK